MSSSLKIEEVNLSNIAKIVGASNKNFRAVLYPQSFSLEQSWMIKALLCDPKVKKIVKDKLKDSQLFLQNDR